MASDWEEIKRLAADFQKVQLTSTLQKLSERNCIEIVQLLLEKKLLEVVFTNDGKEYITPNHLEREVLDELYLNGGRVNLIEISKTLNVDLSRIEEIATRIASDHCDTIHYLLGQLIDENYILNIAQEINEKLSQRGEISISDLTQQFDLPSDFLQQKVVEKHLGKIIKARQDPTNSRNFFTQSYIQRCKAKIKGALAGVTRPTNISIILQQTNVNEKIFFSLFDEICTAGHVTTRASNGQYIPNIYAKMQIDYVQGFYNQNGLLEYETINKLGISDAKAFIKKNFPGEDLLYLKRFALRAKTLELSVISSLNECLATKSYVDLSTILSSNMSEDDIEEVFNVVVSQNIFTPGLLQYINGIVFSQNFLNELLKPGEEMAIANAKKSIENGSYQQYVAEKSLANKNQAVSHFDEEDNKLDKRDERRKKASSGKAGGGGQGRETKTKSTKRNQKGGRVQNSNNDFDDEDDVGKTANAKKNFKQLTLVDIEELTKVLSNQLEDEGLGHLSTDIAELYISQLNQIALSKAQELYEATPQTNRRQTHASVQDKVNLLLVDLRLYEKGIKVFPPDVQNHLVKYLLKSLGNDICNELLLYVSAESNLTLKSNNFNVDQRLKIAQECDEEYRLPLIELNKSLNKTIDEFVVATEKVLKTCSMIIKKVDKKKDKQLLIQHKEKLNEELQQTRDPALVLHLTALILFIKISGCILHASGKFVSNILSYIRSSLPDEINETLLEYHDLVLKLLQSNAESDEAKIINENLYDLQPKVKELAKNFEKPGITRAD